VETMINMRGLGLAAPQVGEDLRVFVVDPRVTGQLFQQDELVFCNPAITCIGGGEVVDTEGCLSFPGAFAPIKRHDACTIEFANASGRVRSLSASGLLARVIQHEEEHLHGVLIIDHLGPVGKRMLRKRLQKHRG
jgi:peptide deformylase